MAANSVELTAKTGLCCSCGICRGICSQGAISYLRKDGMFIPEVDSALCVSCGVCRKICPGLGYDYSIDVPMLDQICGDHQLCVNAWSKDPEKRYLAASGGVISDLLDTLIRQKVYDAAFVVDSYQYSEQLRTVKIGENTAPEDWKNSRIPKSRYLPVSHEDAVTYIRTNADKRVILIGTSCAVRGIRKLLDYLHRNREQYLLIGLFCDSVFNYNVTEYFQNELCGEKTLTALHFKNKESGGWPGNMKLFFSDGTSAYVDQSERTKAKEFFMPERCLYCIDKLDVEADISLGDNYTNQNQSKKGSNTVIIRTLQGMSAWNAVKQKLEYEVVAIDTLKEAQYLEGRKNRFYYACLKERQVLKRTGLQIHLNKNLKTDQNILLFEQAWRIHLKKIRLGQIYDRSPEKAKKKIYQELQGVKTPGAQAERMYYAIKRRVVRD